MTSRLGNESNNAGEPRHSFIRHYAHAMQHWHAKLGGQQHGKGYPRFLSAVNEDGVASKLGKLRRLEAHDE